MTKVIKNHQIIKFVFAKIASEYWVKRRDQFLVKHIKKLD